MKGRLPGCVVERHAELFARWRCAIAVGTLTPPLAVTHVDAHADLGIGDTGAEYLTSEVLFMPVEERRFPKTGGSGLHDGNWQAFRATEPFDVVCLTRSPAYTPREADLLFDDIRARFIDEAQLGA